MTTERTMTARTSARMARTTTMMVATATAVAVVVARLVGWSVGWQGLWHGWGLWLVAWRLHTVGIVQTCFGIDLLWSKMEKNLFGVAGHVQ
jgi:hypothetical protein